jgi:hypothetical protein
VDLFLLDLVKFFSIGSVDIVEYCVACKEFCKSLVASFALVPVCLNSRQPCSFGGRATLLDNS